ncbi:MAG: hypothetical protein KA177_07590 [Paludibacter sp.]|nr:hypothetical protein [Paludibacter sp.]
MQKTTTLSKNTDLKIKKQKPAGQNEIQPSEKVLQNIRRFAAAYRVQAINSNQFVEMILN